MNKNFKHKILAGAMLFGIMLAGSSCEDNDGIKVTPQTPFADKTLYEVVKDDPDLSDFLAVVNACGRECADSLFNQSRVYTLWAPVNDAVDKEALIAEAAVNRDHVFRTFVLAHIANHLVPANGTLESDNSVLLLNDKMAIFTGNPKSGYTFSGIELDPKNTNVRVKNGLVHKIASPAEYKYSIWEYLKVAENVDSVADYLYSFDVVEFNPGQSFPGPLNADGQQTYIDSVFTTSNKLLTSWNGVGNIENEDSTYTIYVPSNAMWSRMVAKAETYYNYDLTLKNIEEEDKIERDSLRRFYSRLNNLKYMAYSVNEQKYLECTDSAMPAFRAARRPRFAIEELEQNVIPGSEKELSNGTFKVVDDMPYTTIDLWHDTIFLEGENKSMWNYGNKEENIPSEIDTPGATKSGINKEDSTLVGAEVSGDRYFRYLKSSGTATAKFKIPKVLSAKYYVAVIFVPENIVNTAIDTTAMLGGKFCFTIRQTNVSKALFQNTTAGTELYTKSRGIDTLFLTNPDGSKAIIEPKYCEYYDTDKGKDGYNVTFQVQSKGPNDAEKKDSIDFDRSIRIDKIMFIPVPEEE